MLKTNVKTNICIIGIHNKYVQCTSISKYYTHRWWTTNNDHLILKIVVHLLFSFSSMHLIIWKGHSLKHRAPMNQGTREPGNQWTTEPENQGTRDPGNQGTSELGNQWTKEPGNQWTREPGNQWTREPGNRWTREPMNQGTREPVN